MGEYAKRKSDGQRVKIGTCESMYYIRWDRKDDVEYNFGKYEYYWRIPFPDEDHVNTGEYEDYSRGVRLSRPVYKKAGIYQEDSRGVRLSRAVYKKAGIYQEEGVVSHYEDFADLETVEDAGTMQVKHPCDLLLNVACYHGVKLPTQTDEYKPFWNGKGHFFELVHIKNLADGTLLPIVRCCVCGKMWRYSWDEVLPYILNAELRARLELYSLIGTEQTA